MTAKILVVDDIEFNVKLLDTKFRQEYYQVFTASNGIQAIAKAKETQPDIILMDIMMPEMDGFEATKIIKSDPNLTHIPIIMVTALNAQEDKVKGLEAGADDFLTKPINDHALMTRLKSLLRLKFMVDELRLRDVTGQQLGLSHSNLEKRNKIDGSNVLLVDDDFAQINKIKAKLALTKVNVDVVNNFEESVATFATKDYSIIIVSTMLMDSDGLWICSQLRSDNNFRNIPILIIVDEHDEKTLDKGLEMGVNDYLISPLESSELLARCVTQIKRKNYQDELKENYLHSITQAYIDPLTGLHNRRYFDTHSANIYAQAKSLSKDLSLLMIDIDHFKMVNDQYGHLSGDAVLRELAHRISSNLRGADICARYGGEEFIILLNGSNTQISKMIAERIRVLVESNPFAIPVAPWKINCTISVGVITLTTEGSVEELISKADQFLYKSKETGRNKVTSAEDVTA
jgi:two-component system, cell cycle response regulator